MEVEINNVATTANMDAELYIFMWAAVCGAAGGIGRFCKNYEMYRKWKTSTIIFTFISCVVVGTVCAMIAVGWAFQDSLVENRLKAFSLATAAGYLPIQLPIIGQMIANAFSKSNSDINTNKRSDSQRTENE